jgi:hypothetical protein
VAIAFAELGDGCAALVGLGQVLSGLFDGVISSGNRCLRLLESDLLSLAVRVVLLVLKMGQADASGGQVGKQLVADMQAFLSGPFGLAQRSLGSVFLLDVERMD